MYRYNRSRWVGDVEGGVKVIVLLAISLLLFASAFPGIRVGLEAYSPAHLAALRFLVASAALAVYAAVTRMRLPAVEDLPAVFFAGGLGITGYHLLLNTAELTVSAGAASFVANTIPIFTAILAAVFLSERLPAAGWLGIGVSFFGVGLIAVGDGGGVAVDPGVFLILIASVGSAAHFVLQKYYMKKYSPLEFTAYAIWAGTTMLLLFAGGLGEAVRMAPDAATAAVVYLGLFPAAIGYVTWARVIDAWSASKASTALFLVPALSLVISWMWLGEVPSLFALVGGVLALTGVGLVRKSGCGIRIWGRSLRASPAITAAAGASGEAGMVPRGERLEDPCRGGARNAPANQPC